MTRYAPQWVQAQSYPASVDRRLIGAVWPQATASGCAVSVQTGTTVMNVAPGWVVVPSANNTGSVLCSSDAVEVVTLDPCPASGTNRIDLVVCQVSSVDIGTAAGDAFIFTFIKGTPAASPAVPALPAGSVALAQVLLIGGGVSVLSANITDLRPAGPNNAQPSTSALVSRTDANGVVWVAKGGVNGGAWLRASDAITARVWRNAAYTPNTAVDVPFDTLHWDPYSCFNVANGRFTAPIPGVYLVIGALTVGSAAAGNIFVAGLFKNGTQTSNGPLGYASAGAQNLTSSATDLVPAAAGDYITVRTGYNPSNLAGITGPMNTWFSLQYLHP